jgi:hypothetical protein
MLARRTWWLATLALTLLPAVLAAIGPAAGAVEPPADPQGGVHIVRPGDTLEQLAAIYLGDARRWPEIARLNPGIGDPKRLPPGRRLRILPKTGNPFAAARIASLSNQVEERPSPIDWAQAQRNDFLVEEDGVRTHPKSSAEMHFGDGTRLVVTEDSLVFLRRSGNRLQGVPRKSIEIVTGQAEVAAERAEPAPGHAPRRSPEIEIVLGKTKATSRPNAAGASQARARRPGEGGAKVMVYGGEGEVEAGGARVAVAEGMGTSVGKEGPPTPPEKLLPAPQIASPLPGIRMGFANPVFTWAPVPEAAAYIVETCRDAGCGALLDRVVLGSSGNSGSPGSAGNPDDTPEWRPPALPVGSLYWRVTARSRSGLDGYPSPAANLEILSDRLDHEPPVAKLTFSGPQIVVDGRLFLAAGFGLDLAADDSGCGLLRALPAVDGSPAEPGEHRASGYALDRCGNRLDLPPVAFTVDSEPPAVRSSLVERSILESEGEPKAVRRSRRRGEPGGTSLFWSSDGRRWLPLWRPGQKAAPDKKDETAENEIASDRPRLFLRARGVKLSIDGQTVAPGEDQLLAITVEDAGAGVERLRFHVTGGGGGKAPALELEAVDLVGNRRQLSWPLVLP